MEAVAAVGEAFLSTTINALLEKFIDADLMNFAPTEKIYNELKKRKDKLRSIRAVLTDAEEKQVTNKNVKIWLNQLRDLAYDVEELLDELEFEALRRKPTAQSHASTSKVKKFFPGLNLKWSAVTFSVQMGSKIKKIGTRLQEIAKEKNHLQLGENVGERATKPRYQRPPTTCLVNEFNVYGREKDKEVILELLLAQKTSDAVVPVIPITGMGGIGKTTLAQVVYNDVKVAEFFRLRAWVHISEDFNVVKVTKDILLAVSPGVRNTINDLNLLQLNLKEKLSGKKFLLVLDDFWHLNYDDWSLFIRPFEVRNSESKIIITTCDQSVPQTTGTLPPHLLKELAYEDCFSILACHALGSRGFDGHPNLKEIGTEIAKKCKGLPLAVITLAGLLRGKTTYREWEAVSKIKMWDLMEEKGCIFPSLGLSYHRLPSHLKACFAYCSLIPKDYEFNRNELVLLWMAEGFVQREDLGHNYFSDLQSRFFFRQSNNNKSLFVMNDHIIELAQFVAGDLYFNMENEVLQIDDGQHYFGNARHVSFISHQYDVSQRFEIFNKMKRIRSFLALPMPYQTRYCYLSCKVLDQLLQKFKCLRVLSLSGYFIGELSNSIGDLKHLRCLNLSNTAIRLLPASVSKLLHLQILKLNQCRELTALPDKIHRLIKLHHLDIDDTPKLQELPAGLGNLTSLRVLPKFITGKAGGLTLRDLKDLSFLQGKLSILGLHNVVDCRDAKVANLGQKHLEELSLEWNLCGNSQDQMQVLEWLHPPKDLQRLSISYYEAKKFPSWVGNPSFSKIVQLELSDCVSCISLPSLGRLPLLCNLSIKGMNKLTSLGPEFYGEGYPVDKAFPSLEFLRFENMTEWKKWISPVGYTEVFPLLRELTLNKCPKLTGKLPIIFCSLEKLNVQRCPQLIISPLSFSSLGELTVEDSSDVILRNVVNQSFITKLKIKRISNLTCLTEELTKALLKLEVLEIEGCCELTCLWRNGPQSDENLPLLKSLVLKNCPELVALVGETQRPCHLSSLQDLRIESCQKFVSFPATGLPYTLKGLKILHCLALESLPETFGTSDGNNHHCQLEELEIIECPSLKFSPKGRLPLTLKRLRIKKCRNIQCLSHGMVRGDDNENSESHLEYLCVGDCLASDSFLECGLSITNLKIFLLSNCMNLRALPNQMRKLTSLQELSLSDCEALTSIPEGGLPPNLTSLEISNCQRLDQRLSKWGLDKLHCLKEIKIAGICPAADMVSFPEEGVVLPSTLTNLCIISLQNLESLSRGFENLIALQELDIKDCRRLRCLPKTGLPASLGRLCISGSPVLEDKCKRERGEYWPILSDIPCLEINPMCQN